jgi:DNA helicase IV
MIVDGKLLFFSTESTTHSRELIYQEHFTRQKQGFILPEVVEQMEKAQDQVVRAHYRGPFVISGPAGSGKTTLALHRVAYLAQSPETAEYFTPETVLVLVQDKGTKDYFSHLLPELGIHGVVIRTFAEWAFAALNLEGYTFAQRYGATESEQIKYEYAKLSALKADIGVAYNKNIFSVLQKVYENFFDATAKKIFKQQKDERVLDRFDLTILLAAFQKTKGAFVVEKEYYEELANGSYRKRKGSFPLHYNLAIVDEFQNYLPEQLALIKSCLNHRLESVVYVGDIAQQTQLGTVRDWSHIGGQLQPERLVTLQKVYRNTKQILRYIKDLGYSIDVPQELKEGKEVVEKTFVSPEQECAYIKNSIAEVGNTTVGILAKNKKYLTAFKEFFGNQENIFCLSFQEAQGVEFDNVFIVGVEKEMFDLPNIPEQIVSEVKKIERDLLYVALTRAMAELHILGSSSLSESLT